MSRLAGKVAIVTGGAGGIGAATARELARVGAAVAVVDIDEAKATEVADEIRSTSARAIALGGDLAEEEAARHVVQSTVAEFGRIDVLHNNAALTTSSFLSRDTTVSEMPLDVWQRVFGRQPRKSAVDVQVRGSRNAKERRRFDCQHVLGGGGAIR